MPYKEGIYFITFTCYEWMPLIELADAYDAVYHQFDILKLEGHYVLGFVIMPNHVHALLGMRDKGKSINKRIGTLKRFLAYDLVQRLQESEKTDVLEELSRGVPATDRNRGKLHQVFEPSFDCKECFSEEMIIQKLEYMPARPVSCGQSLWRRHAGGHENPCKGIWQLAESPVDYKHSSALFYITGEQGLYAVTHYMEMEDIDLTKN